MKNCKEVTLALEKIILKEENEKLTLAIQAHLLVCRYCKDYFVDSKIIHNYLLKLSKNQLELSLSENGGFVDRVLEKIKELD